MAAAAPKKTFLEAMMATLAKQETVVNALPDIFKVKDAFTWTNSFGHAKTRVEDMPTIEQLRSAFPAVFEQLSAAIQDTVPSAIAAIQGSSSSSVIIDCAAFAKTLEDLFIGERRLGKFWARWLVFHFLMGITPGFKWPDMDGVDVEGADVNTSYSLPSLSKEFSMMGMIHEALGVWTRETFDDSDVIESLNVHVHLEGTALTAEDVEHRPVEFHDRTLVLVLTTGEATTERCQLEMTEKARRKASAKEFYRAAAKKERQRARDTAACKEDPISKTKQPGAFTLARAAGISGKPTKAIASVGACAGGGR